jgi:hypothetical protein
MQSTYARQREKHEKPIALIEQASAELEDATRQARQALWAAAVTLAPDHAYWDVRDALLARAREALAKLEAGVRV